MISANLGGVEIGEGLPVVIIGAINLGKDTFYKGSFVRGAKEAVKRAREMIEGGASIIDFGAMSTGPRSKSISTKGELGKLIPIIRAISRELDVAISADTQRAEVARASIEAGADIINDISGLKADPDMADVIASAGCSAILMAAKKLPGDVYEVEDVKRALNVSLKICKEHGISMKKVAVDPAIGHWPARLVTLATSRRRFKEQRYSLATFADLKILANLKELRITRPICVGISRKSFIGGVLDLPSPEDRLVGSLAATTIAVLNGAHALRTHDPLETLQAARIAEAIKYAWVK